MPLLIVRARPEQKSMWQQRRSDPSHSILEDPCHSTKSAFVRRLARQSGSGDSGLTNGGVFQHSGNEKKPARVEYSPCLRLSAANILCISPLPCVLSSHRRDHPADQWPPNCLREKYVRTERTTSATATAATRKYAADTMAGLGCAESCGAGRLHGFQRGAAGAGVLGLDRACD